MAWYQAIITIGLANVIVLIPMLLISHAGTKYGIPYPVFARASFGTYGANLPAIMRALVACGWFGIQTWIGGTAIFARGRGPARPESWWTTAGTISIGIGAAAAQPWTMWLSFAIFWALNILIILWGMEAIKRFENWAAPFLIVVFVGPHDLDGQRGRRPRPGGRGVRHAGLGPGVLGDLPDLAHGHDRVLVHALPQHAGLHPFRAQPARAGGRPGPGPADDDDPVPAGRRPDDLGDGRRVRRGDLGPGRADRELDNPIILLVMLVALAVATLSTNVAANVVSPSYDFSNAWPKRISFRTGGIITGIIGVLIMPWNLLADSNAYIFTWLGTYGGAPAHRRRAHRRLLVGPPAAAPSRRPVQGGRRLPLRRRLELDRGRRAARRRLIAIGGAYSAVRRCPVPGERHHPVPQAVLRLQLGGRLIVAFVIYGGLTLTVGKKHVEPPVAEPIPA
jgi:nucleobase:cation symporter-1, NCS1 family